MKSANASVGFGVTAGTFASSTTGSGTTISTSRASSSARSSASSSSSRSCSSANASRAASSIAAFSSASSRNAGTAVSSRVLRFFSLPLLLRRCRATAAQGVRLQPIERPPGPWYSARDQKNSPSRFRFRPPRPVDLPLPRTALRRGFVLLALRARRKRQPNGPARSRQGPPKTHVRSLRRFSLGGAVVGLERLGRQALQQPREHHELVAGEALAEEAAYAADVRLARLAELRLAFDGQLRVRHPRVARAGRPLDVAGALEPFEQPGDPRRREQHALGEVDSAQALAVRAREVQQDLVIVERQPVLGDELGVQSPRRRGMRTQEPDPGLDLRSDGS